MCDHEKYCYMRNTGLRKLKEPGKLWIPMSEFLEHSLVPTQLLGILHKSKWGCNFILSETSFDLFGKLNEFQPCRWFDMKLKNLEVILHYSIHLCSMYQYHCTSPRAWCYLFQDLCKVVTHFLTNVLGSSKEKIKLLHA